jgi:LuxR family transcriptional regulator, quorum-sensing system regulator BjaR1
LLLWGAEPIPTRFLGAMAYSLESAFDAIGGLGAAATPHELCGALTKFTGNFGLTSMFAASLPSRHERKEAVRTRHLLVGAFPSAWIDRYFAQDYAHIDPIVHCSKRGNEPFLWSDAARYVRPEHGAIARRMFGEACEFNLKAGFVVPVRAPDGGRIAMSLGGERAEVPPEAWPLISVIGAVAMGYAVEMRERDQRRLAAGLSEREAECLKWAADGKSEWEIGEILKISVHTADKHLANARRKLGAANRAQAVANAIRWGIIR